MFDEGREVPPNNKPQYLVIIGESDEPAYLVPEDWLEAI